MDKRVLGYREYLDLIRELYEKVKNEKTDAILCILRGGYYPSIYISRKMRVPVLYAGIRSYHGQNQEDVKIYRQPKIEKERRIIIVDDLADTGKSLEAAKDLVKEFGDIKIKYAVLFKKPWSSVEPEFYVEETDKWIVFPYERSLFHRFLFSLYFWYSTKLI